MLTKNGTKEIPGYRIKPMLPIATAFGGSCVGAEFVAPDGNYFVIARVRLGLAPSPYLLHLSIEQALEADIIERTE